MSLEQPEQVLARGAVTRQIDELRIPDGRKLVERRRTAALLLLDALQRRRRVLAHDLGIEQGPGCDHDLARMLEVVEEAFHRQEHLELTDAKQRARARDPR